MKINTFRIFIFTVCVWLVIGGVLCLDQYGSREKRKVVIGLSLPIHETGFPVVLRLPLGEYRLYFTTEPFREIQDALVLPAELNVQKEDRKVQLSQKGDCSYFQNEVKGPISITVVFPSGTGLPEELFLNVIQL